INANKPRQILKSSMLTAIDDCEEIFVDDPSFSKAISIVDALKFIRQAFYNGNPSRYDLISSREKAFFKDYIENAEKNQGLLNSYLDSTQQYARISLQVADIGTIEMDSLLSVVEPRIDQIFNPKRQKQDSLLSLIQASKDGAFQDSLAHYVLSRNTGAKRAFERSMSANDSSGFDISALKIGSDGELLSLLKESIDEEYVKVRITGPSVTFLEGTNYLVRNLFVSLGIAIIIVALLMAAVFSSFRMIVVSVITNLIPLLFTAAVMGYFGIAIKPSTLLVFSIAFGISVDDTIHYLAKYRQELKHHRNDIGEAVRSALKETGVSMVYTSIILFFGFSVFDSSQFGGTQALGLLVSLTLLIAMFANLILLPSFLMSFERRMITKSFEEPYFTILDEEEDLELDNLDFDESQRS
ncbi:MAG: efflux RND transporter permease subunit, partial [Flavobacteriales bacterium]